MAGSITVYTVWAPGASVRVVKVTRPAETAVSATPGCAAPSMTNVTVPAVGVSVPGAWGATVAVNVTGCPGYDGGAPVSTVVVPAADTRSDRDISLYMKFGP